MKQVCQKEKDTTRLFLFNAAWMNNYLLYSKTVTRYIIFMEFKVAVTEVSPGTLKFRFMEALHRCAERIQATKSERITVEWMLKKVRMYFATV